MKNDIQYAPQTADLSAQNTLAGVFEALVQITASLLAQMTVLTANHPEEHPWLNRQPGKTLPSLPGMRK